MNEDNKNCVESLSEPESILETVTDLVVPRAIKNNIYKAISQLTSALVEIPSAYLDGKANEIRARYEERIKLTHVTGDQIANQLQIDPEYARIAAKKYGYKLIREQVNLDMTVSQAIDEIKNYSSDGIPNNEQEISEDWINNFESEARKKSSKEMRTNFSKILAGEIQQPNTFSIRTVKILGSLDQNSAELFQLLCSASIALRVVANSNSFVDARMVSLGGNPSQNCLSKYGLGYNRLAVLNEYGLIASDLNSWRDYGMCIGKSGLIDIDLSLVYRWPFLYQGEYWVLEPHADYQQKHEFRLNGVALTEAGRQLMRIVQPIKMDEYTRELSKYFNQIKLNMKKSKHKNPHLVEIS